MKLLSYLQTTHHLSRRTITQYIKDAKILVNGRVIEGFGSLLNDGDTIEIPGIFKKISVNLGQPTTDNGQLIVFNKPIGYVVSKSDPHNPTIFEILPKEYQHYYPIGRLDKESSGLLLLSNDPKLVHELSHPSKEHKKIYHVTLNKFLSDFHRDEMLKGISVDHHGDPSDDPKSDNLKFEKIYAIKEKVYEVTLTEGKNRHIRRLCRALGYRVESLHRVSFGKLKIGDLEIGITRTTPPYTQ